MSLRPRHFVPVFFTLVLAYLSAGPFSRLHLLFLLFAKPAMTLAFAGLLLFVIVRAADICRLLQLGPSAWWIRRFAILPSYPLPWHPRLEPVRFEAPGLTPLFQRPPPSASR